MFVPINSLSLALSLLRGSPDSVVQCSSRVQWVVQCSSRVQWVKIA